MAPPASAARTCIISDRAHLVMPYHVLIDQLEERERGREAWDDLARHRPRLRGQGRPARDPGGRPDGCRSLSPAAGRRAGSRSAHRTGYFRAGGPDDELREAIERVDRRRRDRRRYLGAGERLRPHVVDGQEMVDRAPAGGQRILLEGQLGTMRDIDWGVYPYVTSSSPIPGGASLGAGLPAVAIDRVLGVAKAYTTAVGAGPLPTELARRRRRAPADRGAEYGTSTGRARRCGWYDAIAVRFSVRLAGYSSIALTKLDVLDAFERIPIAHAYRDPTDGREWQTVPASEVVYGRLEAGVRGAPGLGKRHDRLPLMGVAARSGARVCRAPRIARRCPRQPYQRRSRASANDRALRRVAAMRLRRSRDRGATQEGVFG